VSPNGFRHRISIPFCEVDGVWGLRQGYRAGFDGQAVTVEFWRWMGILVG
jgi:hypothetical protein